ncbi:MAG: tetratricopeptide repeat protein [Phycisphaerales bacterium]|nr:tetratricopeptide repeat protein [Phycisphaerales bacterium]
MAIDKRQQQIQVGAGLEESRYSQDFIELLRTYLAPVLMIVALVVLGYQGWKWWQNRQIQATATAFKELDAATLSGNPMSLLRVAEDHAGQQAVEPLARLKAADILLESAYAKIAPGAEFLPDGKLKSETDRLTDAQAVERIAQAEAQYRMVLNEFGDVRGKEIHAIGGAFGLAAIGETRKAWDDARVSYDRVIALSDRAGFKTAADIARQRIASLDALKVAADLPSKASVKTRYDRRVVSYTLTPDQVRDGLAVEPVVTQPDGRRVDAPANVPEFAPTLLKPKAPAPAPAPVTPAMEPTPTPAATPTATPPANAPATKP